jgi:hypothetical protein
MLSIQIVIVIKIAELSYTQYNSVIVPLNDLLRCFTQPSPILVGQPPPQRGRKPHPRHIPPVVQKYPLGKLAERHLQDQTLDLGLGKLGDSRHARPRLLRGKTVGDTVQVAVAEGEGELCNGHCSVLVRRFQQAAQEYGLVGIGHVHLFTEGEEALADVCGGHRLQGEKLDEVVLRRGGVGRAPGGLGSGQRSFRLQ